MSGNTLYVGGDFYSIGGHTHPNIAAIDATTGKLRNWDPHADPEPSAITSMSMRSRCPAPLSTSAATSPRLAASPATTSPRSTLCTGDATGWNPNARGDGVYRDGDVAALALSGNRVYAGGRFASIGGQTRNAIAALNTTTGKATSWNPNPTSDYDAVNALEPSGRIVYAGGSFTRIGGQARNGLAALDATTGRATSWNPRAGANALAVSGTTVYAGGGFKSSYGEPSIGGQPRDYLAALDATTGRATPWNPSPVAPYAGVFRVVSALAIGPDGSVWVGGGFSGFPTAPQSGIAKFAAMP